MAKYDIAPAGGGMEFRLRLTLENDPGRKALERFLHNRYARAFGAQLSEFMPWLVEMHDGVGNLNGVIGLRSAAAGTLFLERYLAAPAEQAISTITGIATERSGLVELGNLAAVSPGALRQLIVSLMRCLHGAGLQWALFTLLPSTRNTFARLGLPLIPLAEARPECLPQDARAEWGTYYERKPWVMAGCLAEGSRVLETRAPQRATSICVRARTGAAWA
jgi:hypothetical protein